MKIPDVPPPTGELLAGLSGGQLRAGLDAGRPVDGRGRYLHWDEMRHRTPPGGSRTRRGGSARRSRGA